MKKIKKLDRRGDVSILLIILVVILLILGVGFYIWQKNNTKSSSKSSNSSSQYSTPNKTSTTPTTTSDKTACTEPSASAVENIKASITSGNTAALEGYMATKVTVIIAASEGIGEQTPSQAVQDITNFIGDPTTTTWDFNLSASVVSGYGKSFYKSYFPSNAVVGKSSAKKVISFSFDCNGKISTVFEAANEDLLQ